LERYCPQCERSFADREKCPEDGAALVLLGEDPLLGRDLAGRFKVEARLGAGGMGVVYRALQTSIGRGVALKLMHAGAGADALAQKRFLREVKLASRLAHPNVVSIYDFGSSDDGAPFYAMELLRGRTLDEIKDSDGPFAPERLVRVGVQLCDALEAAHGLDILHRDLKPSNVMILDDPSSRDFVKVLDFGLARSIAAPTSVTRSGHVVGTPRYLAPEVAAGEAADQRSDLYSLGVLLRELAQPALPPRLVNVIEKLTAPEPKDRYRSAAQAREALAVALDRAPGTAATVEERRSHAVERPRRLAAQFSIVVVAVAAGVMAIGYAGPHAHDPREWALAAHPLVWAALALKVAALAYLILTTLNKGRPGRLAWFLPLGATWIGSACMILERRALSAQAGPLAPFDRFLSESLATFRVDGGDFICVATSITLFLALSVCYALGEEPRPRGFDGWLPLPLALLALAAVFAGFAGVSLMIGTAALALAIGGRERLEGRVAALLAVYFAMMLVGFRHTGREAWQWSGGATRSVRAHALLAIDAEYTREFVLGVVLLVALVGYEIWRGRRGQSLKPSLIGWGFLAAFALGLATDLTTFARGERERTALRQQLSAQLAPFDHLTPPSTGALDGERFRPHAAPSLQLSQGSIGIDGHGVALRAALAVADGRLNLARDLGHALANAPRSGPDLTLLADGKLGFSDVAAALEAARAAGVRRVEALVLRGDSPDDSGDALYLPGDFVAIPVELSGAGAAPAGARSFAEVAAGWVEQVRATGAPIHL
jgi:hypothetical protein